MVAWYRHYIAAWMDGTEELTDSEYRVYHVVCQLIYLNDGPITRHDRGIAGRCNQDVRRTKPILNRLISIGKLHEKSGQLSNDRTESELGHVEVKGGSQGVRKGFAGTTKGVDACKPLKNNNPPSATPPLEKTIEEKRREEKEVKAKRPNGRSHPLPISEAFNNWNKAADVLGLARASKLTTQRERKLRARLNEHGLDGWNEALANLGASEFCQGKNDRGWKADLDFMLQETSFNRLLEGSYSQEADDGLQG